MGIQHSEKNSDQPAKLKTEHLSCYLLFQLPSIWSFWSSQKCCNCFSSLLAWAHDL